MDDARAKNGKEQRPNCCNPVKQAGPVTMDHVLLALGETKEERELRIRSLFNFFDGANSGFIDYTQIEKGLSSLLIPADYKYAKDLLNVCDANQDGRVDYQEFKRHMDDKELELYLIFQAIDVEHNGCILPEELYDALIRAELTIAIQSLKFIIFTPPSHSRILHFQYSCLSLELQTWIFFFCFLFSVVNSLHVVLHSPLKNNVKRIYGKTFILQVQTARARMIPAIKNIWKEGGVLAFFRGNALNVLKVAPESALRFYTYEMLKEVIVKAKGEGNKADVGTTGRLFAGGFAGAVAQTAIYPMDLVKTRLQTYTCKNGKVPNLGAMSRDIWVQEGPRAFYRGLVPSLLGIIPYAGIDLAAYETFKDMSKKYILRDSEPGPLVQLGCGTLSGALGATCVYPLQVVRTRMQAHRTNTGTAYEGMSDVFRRTFQHEGIRGLYKGIFPNMLKVVPSASITYMVYEAMKKRLDLE
ncbi:ADP,ATP carrier protein, putative [Ricinus communis]|uniref:ADP,ATP carrier protein, putative n=1 Tax=Ricinus communis TaxID=3988 RepID=B9RGV3_RICCO|nr:ADP,ATP carrier protein, putative [Ricinus communis]